MPTQYIEQLKRVKRWHKRLEEIYLGREHSRDTDYYQDVLYSFFQNCFHLKDWLITSRVINGNVINTFINSEDSLKICRDICNGSKHFKITNPSIDPNIKIKNRNFSLSIGNQPTQIKIIYWIEASGSSYHAFDIATHCLVLWEKFLKQYGLKTE